VNFDPDAILASIPWIGAAIRGDSRGSPRFTRFLEQALPSLVVGLALITYQDKESQIKTLENQVIALRGDIVAASRDNAEAIAQFKLRHENLAAQVNILNIKAGYGEGRSPR